MQGLGIRNCYSKVAHTPKVREVEGHQVTGYGLVGITGVMRFRLNREVNRGQNFQSTWRITTRSTDAMKKREASRRIWLET